MQKERQRAVPPAQRRPIRVKVAPQQRSTARERRTREDVEAYLDPFPPGDVPSMYDSDFGTAGSFD